MGSLNYYSILMISENASQKEIKRAYRRCVRLYHPDVSGSETAEKFRVVVKAYKVLGDPTERCRYDQVRKMKPKVDAASLIRRDAKAEKTREESWLDLDKHRRDRTSHRREASPRTPSYMVSDPELMSMPVSELLDRVKNSTNRHVRQKAIELLEKRRVTEAVGVLIESVNDPIREVRLASLRALGELRSRRAVEAVAAALASPYWQIRHQALVALGKIGSRQVVPMVAKLLEDPCVPVREEAVRTMSVIGDRNSIRTLKERMKDEDKAVRKSIRDAISKLKLGWKGI